MSFSRLLLPIALSLVAIAAALVGGCASREDDARSRSAAMSRAAKGPVTARRAAVVRAFEPAPVRAYRKARTARTRAGLSPGKSKAPRYVAPDRVPVQQNAPTQRSTPPAYAPAPPPTPPVIVPAPAPAPAMPHPAQGAPVVVPAPVPPAAPPAAAPAAPAPAQPAPEPAAPPAEVPRNPVEPTEPPAQTQPPAPPVKQPPPEPVTPPFTAPPNRAILTPPNDASAVAIASGTKGVAPGRRTAVTEGLTEARKLFQRGRVAEARALLESMLDTAPPAVLHELGRTYDPYYVGMLPRMNRGSEPQRAAAFYREAILQGARGADTDLDRLRTTHHSVR